MHSGRDNEAQHVVCVAQLAAAKQEVVLAQQHGRLAIKAKLRRDVVYLVVRFLTAHCAAQQLAQLGRLAARLVLEQRGEQLGREPQLRVRLAVEWLRVHPALARRTRIRATQQQQVGREALSRAHPHHVAHAHVLPCLGLKGIARAHVGRLLDRSEYLNDLIVRRGIRAVAREVLFRLEVQLTQADEGEREPRGGLAVGERCGAHLHQTDEEEIEVGKLVPRVDELEYAYRRECVPRVERRCDRVADSARVGSKNVHGA